MKKLKGQCMNALKLESLEKAKEDSCLKETDNTNESK